MAHKKKAHMGKMHEKMHEEHHKHGHSHPEEALKAKVASSKHHSKKK